jgi:hypothetical protein
MPGSTGTKSQHNRAPPNDKLLDLFRRLTLWGSGSGRRSGAGVDHRDDRSRLGAGIAEKYPAREQHRRRVILGRGSLTGSSNAGASVVPFMGWRPTDTEALLD